MGGNGKVLHICRFTENSWGRSFCKAAFCIQRVSERSDEIFHDLFRFCSGIKKILSKALKIVQKDSKKSRFLKSKTENLSVNVFEKQVALGVIYHQMKIFCKLVQWMLQDSIDSLITVRKHGGENLLPFIQGQRAVKLFGDLLYPSGFQKLLQAGNSKVNGKVSWDQKLTVCL